MAVTGDSVTFLDERSDSPSIDDEFSSIVASSSNFQSPSFPNVIPQPTLTSPTTVGQSSRDHGGENGTTQAVPTGQQMHVVPEQQMHVHVAQEQVMNFDQNEQILSVDLHPTDGAESDVDGSAAGQPDNSETRHSVPLH
ncbi:hypothetical protein V6N12_038738 [Hibiscus sabdariffa]|uniref:Uncharacterized protein n=1 Tax=Hibiscus sabdariffa TaxID=183260 RepID=A0ABR2CAQ6_9ROSI